MGAGLRTNAKVVGFSTGPYRRRASPRPYLMTVTHSSSLLSHLRIGQESMRQMVVAWRAIHAWRERILSAVQVS